MYSLLSHIEVYEW